ncbi:MAG: VanZ family protein [Lachnospiraceae bacterium]
MEQKKRKQACICLCLLLLWMGVIFSFSAQKAKESSHLSSGIAYRLVHETEEIFSIDWSEKTETSIIEVIEFPIRKAAHMTEYAILGLLFFGSFSAWKANEWIKYATSQAGAMLYAATDEFHQTFVQGRDGSIRDVFIDGAGCLIALLLLAGVRRIRKKKQEKKDEKNNMET